MKPNPYKSKKNKQRKAKIPGSRSFIFEDERPLFVDSYKKKAKKAWLIPLFAALLILFTVFWFGPRIADILSAGGPDETPSDQEPELIYNDQEYAVVRVPFADLLAEPDLRSSRLSQILYNDPLKIISEGNTGFIYVELPDGAKGYVMIKDTTHETDSAEPARFEHKLTITSRTKRIMSHASQGSMLIEAVMGTVLFSNYSGEGVYRVALAGGGQGWISSEGVVRTDVFEDPLQSNATKFYETTLLYANSTYISNGLTVYGASSPGIAFISAKINGINLPRDMISQSTAGAGVSFRTNIETGMPVFDDFLEGDLLFFSKKDQDPAVIDNMGIVVGYGRVLMSISGRNSVRITDLTAGSMPDLEIVSARRLFAQP